MKFHTVIDGKTIALKFSENLDKLISANNKQEKEINIVPLSKYSYSLIMNGKTHHLSIRPQPEGFDVTVDHQTHLVQVKDELEVLLEQFGIESDAQDHAGEIHAQIPGLISKIFVKNGDAVEKNDKLFILEAMKMENEIDSPVTGKVKTIHISSGQTVEKGFLIMEITN